MGSGRFSNRFKSYRYLNGNYLVHGSSYGSAFFTISKRALRYGEELKSCFPDSIDLKITNKCRYGCPFCHESSTPEGNSFNPEKTKEILSQLPVKPIELAIGGGNVLEIIDKEGTEEFFDWLQSRGFRIRITINLKDLMSTGDERKDKRIIDFINKYAEGLGISITDLKLIDRNKVSRLYLTASDIIDATDLGQDLRYGPQIVYHIIAGIFPIDDLKFLIDHTRNSVLVLGYKQWGRAKDNELPNLTEWKTAIKDIIMNTETDLKGLGFDNLALGQLEIRNVIDENRWKRIYMGDEGSCSMYIDAVKGEYALNSRSPERVGWNNIKLLDYYASLSK